MKCQEIFNSWHFNNALEVVQGRMKKAKKRLCIVLVGLFLLLLIPVINYGIVHFWQSETSVTIEQVQSLSKKEAAVVPGTSGNNGSLTAKAEDRLLAAITLYEKGLVQRIIVSGDEDEVAPMTRYLIKNGIPVECLASDPYGVDTYETIARIKEKFGKGTYYFCTQELYSNRARYLMDRLGMEGTVVCADARYYCNVGKNTIREFLAATKAVVEPIVHFGKAKTSVEEKEYAAVEKPVENSHFVQAEDLETPEDCKTEDKNPSDDYDVQKAVEYARTYALEPNADYGQFEQNCTNFVSQCLAAGGISMQGDPEFSETKRWNISGKSTDWYSVSKKSGKDALTHYSMSQAFVNTDAFFEYFTKERGYSFSRYNNDRAGNKKCYKEMAAGDVLVLYNEDGTVAHLGIVSGIGKNNAYYCGNTAKRRDASIFTISDETYLEMGLLHMSK